jgi:predicted NAD-dependent protein-ADP-ribosyltransferase YbiA (DUF1768 family)
MNFWERIARGHDKLTKFEDATLWKMRAAGDDWHAIEERINALRRNRALADASAKALQEMTALPSEACGIDRNEAAFWRRNRALSESANASA